MKDGKIRVVFSRRFSTRVGVKGQNTVHAAAYSGKLVIGISMQFEQQLNLEALMRYGVGMIVSKKYFSEKKLVKTVKTIFNNYGKFLKHAQKLAEILPKPRGEEGG